MIYFELSSKKKLAMELLDESRNLYVKTMYSQSLESCLKAQSLFREIGDEKQELITIGNCGATYDSLKNFKKALQVDT